MIKSAISLGGTAIPSRVRKIEKSDVNSAQSLEIIPIMTSFFTDFNAEYWAPFTKLAPPLSLRGGSGTVEPEGFTNLGGGNPDEATCWEVVSKKSARVVRDRCGDYDEFGYNWYGFCTCDVHEEDGSTQFVATGSFDCTVRTWTSDGQPLHVFSFVKAISAIAYVPHHRALWIADSRKVCGAARGVGGSHGQLCFVFDPKSGEDITKFLGTFRDQAAQHPDDFRCAAGSMQ